MNLKALDSGIAPFSHEGVHRSTPRIMDPGKVSSRSLSINNTDAMMQATTKSMNPRAQSFGCSKSIPISKSMTRTQSELQLVEDEATADFRDYCMYTRIVNGINSKGQRHRSGAGISSLFSNDNESVKNIIRTRHLPVRDLPSLNQEDSLRDQYWREENPYSTPVESASHITDSYHKYDSWSLSSQSRTVYPENHDDEEIFVLDM
jgi:hypothetical protein